MRPDGGLVCSLLDFILKDGKVMICKGSKQLKVMKWKFPVW